jgi:hypothetical protein
MIAEYRRILKNPTPERKKKCIFFDALHKIYQAKDSNAIKMALNNYEEEYNFEPIEFNNTDDNMDGTNDNNDGDNSGTDNEDKSEIFAYSLSPSATLNHNAPTTNGSNAMDLHSNNGLSHFFHSIFYIKNFFIFFLYHIFFLFSFFYIHFCFYRRLSRRSDQYSQRRYDLIKLLVNSCMK